jgi:phosphoribosylanthranilate isomerase
MILKICGITNQSDADAAIAAGANAIGFNFYPKSPRHIDPAAAGEIETAPGVRRVGVFVNEPRERVDEIGRAARLDVAQLHGDETPQDYPALTIWKAARVIDGYDLAAYADVPAEALVLDGPAGALYGGAGVTFDWAQLSSPGAQLEPSRDRKGVVVASHAPRPRIILAGGLDASNVARAISVAHPWGVDACSRIESTPGKKDHSKMIDFLHAAKAALHS